MMKELHYSDITVILRTLLRSHERRRDSRNYREPRRKTKKKIQEFDLERIRGEGSRGRKTQRTQTKEDKKHHREKEKEKRKKKQPQNTNNRNRTQTTHNDTNDWVNIYINREG